MRVIVPEPLTILSSTVAEPDTGEQMWSPDPTYGLGDMVISPISHRLYESLQAGNVNHLPPVPPFKQNDWWLERGVSNRYACIDMDRNSQSVGASPMVVTVTAGKRVNAFAAMGMEADSVRIRMFVGAEVVYDKTFNLQLRRVRNGFDYCFKPFQLNPTALGFDLPLYSSATVEVTLTRASGDVRLGSIVLGTYAYLGAIKWNAVNDGISFSSVTRDIDGSAELVSRPGIPATQQTLRAPKNIAPDLEDIRRRLDGKPAVWSGLDDLTDNPFHSLVLISGIWKRFQITDENVNEVLVALELEEIR